MGWFGGGNDKPRPPVTTINGIPVTAPQFTGPGGPAALAALAAKNKSDYDARELAANTPTPPIISTTSYGTAASAAERQRKRAAGGSTLVTPGTTGPAARALLAPRTLVGGGA
jgi:hypothetical protein